MSMQSLKTAVHPAATVAIGLLAMLQSGCMLTGMEYSYGITRYEAIKEIKAVWVAKQDGSIAIELETIQYSRDESKVYSPRDKDDPPIAARLPERPSRRRWIVIDGASMEKLVRSARDRYRYDDAPGDQLEVVISARYSWIVPKEFDGPDVVASSLPVPLTAGYTIYAWQEPVQKQSAQGREYRAWPDPIYWSSHDGRQWKLSLEFFGKDAPLRHERPPHVYDASVPVFVAADIVLTPVYLAAGVVILAWSFVAIAIWGL
jgi:hypothetical protein